MTSAMAPVIQLDLPDSRNDTAFAMSSGLPGAGYAGCPPQEVADQSEDVFRYESPDLATPLRLLDKEGSTARCPRVLTHERG
jgi:hypothetical protein